MHLACVVLVAVSNMFTFNVNVLAFIRDSEAEDHPGQAGFTWPSLTHGPSPGGN